MQKPFNAINGLEALELVMNDIRNLLSRDGRFRQNLTYHQLSFAVAVQVRTFPVDAGSFEAEAQGVVGRAPEGARALTPPPVPVIPRAQEPGHLKPAAQGGNHIRENEPLPVEAPGGISDEAFEDELRRRGLAPSNDAALLGRGPRPQAQPETPISEVDERPNPKTLAGAPRTAAGDVITGGATEPDGAVLEMASRHRQAHEAQMALERQRAALDAAGPAVSERVVENPNEARREVGMPVPEPRRVDGNVVDVTRDQF